MFRAILLVIDGDYHFIKMPFVARLRPVTADFIGILLSKLPTPLPN